MASLLRETVELRDIGGFAEVCAGCGAGTTAACSWFHSPGLGHRPVMLVESSCFQLACFCSVSPFASTPLYRCVANVNVCFHSCYGASTLAHFSIF